MSSSFLQAYRRLNVFLFIFSICPFLQCKQTNRFVCKRKYFAYVCTTTITYFVYVLYLSSFRFPISTDNIIEMVDILKLCRTMGNAYTIFLVVIFLLIERQAHANYFNKLYQFDCIYNKLVNPTIEYTAMNRMFWIEVITFTSYLCFMFVSQLKSQEPLWYDVLFWACEIGEQCVYAFAMFHMKNCAFNLIVRLQKVNTLLRKFSVNKSNVNISNVEYSQLEHVMRMLDILLNARDNLQNAFGLAFLLMFVYNLFAVTLSSYIMINANFNENNHHNQHDLHNLHYNLAKYLCFELPLIFKDFYCIIYYHCLGRTVRFMWTNLFSIWSDCEINAFISKISQIQRSVTRINRIENIRLRRNVSLNSVFRLTYWCQTLLTAFSNRNISAGLILSKDATYDSMQVCYCQWFLPSELLYIISGESNEATKR